jgi:hypothetical protein
MGAAVTGWASQTAAERVGAATGRHAMRLSTLALIAALGGGAMLAGCVEEEPYGYLPYGPYADADYFGYYDGYYGPFYGGYWGPGGYFYYADRDGRRYHRDSERHFRRESGGDPRYHEVHSHTPPAQGGQGGPRGDGQGH